MESIRRKIEEQLNNSDIKLCIRTYSDKLLGYRIFLDDDVVIFLNNLFEREVMSNAFDKLALLSDKYIEYGFIMLLSNNELYCCPHYSYSEQKGHYELSIFNDNQGNLIQLDKSLIEVKKNKKIIEKLKKGMNIND